MWGMDRFEFNYRRMLHRNIFRREHRVVSRTLIWPKKVNGKWKWLCRAKIRQTTAYHLSRSGELVKRWLNVGWDDLPTAHFPSVVRKEVNGMVIKCDAQFNIKGRGLVYLANVNDNPGVDFDKLPGQEIEVEAVHNPQPPLNCAGKRYRVVSCEFTQNTFGRGKNVGIVVSEKQCTTNQ